MHRNYFNNKSAFTIIELLIVLVIVFIVAVVSTQKFFKNSNIKTNDSKRITDVNQIKLALEEFYEKNNKYPPLDAQYSSQTSFISDTVPQGATDWIPEIVPNNIASLPRDPTQVVGASGSAGFITSADIIMYGLFMGQWSAMAATGTAIAQTTDGGLIHTTPVNRSPYNSSDYYDITVSKYSSVGLWQWSKKIGGANVEIANEIIQNPDGSYLLAGYTASYGAGGDDGLIEKLDTNGNLVWTKVLGETNYDRLSAVIPTSDGYIVSGETMNFGVSNIDALLAKFDLNGNLQWTRTIGGSSNENAQFIRTLSDGSIVTTGYTYSWGAGANDAYITKYSSSGTFVWNKTIGTSAAEVIYGMTTLNDDGIVITGYTNTGGSVDILLTKLDSAGTHLWSKRIGGATVSDMGQAITKTTDGGFAITGITSQFGTARTLIYKFDTNGNLQWAATYADPSGKPSAGYSIVQTANSGFMLRGYVGTDPNYYTYVMKVDSDGKIDGCQVFSTVTPTINTLTPSVSTPASTRRSPVATSSSITPPNSNITPITSSICSQSTSSGGTYYYYVAADRKSYSIWAKLENSQDPRIYNKPSAQCTTSPPDPNYNFCGTF